MSNGNAARDGYESYYVEKLWQLVPEVYRNEDGLALNPGVLRRIVEMIGAEAARTRRSIDRLWEDQHIETCDDWAVPYIAELVGTRLVSAADRRARRVDVANTVKFRRRRGTPDLLDSLVRAMSGWDVVLVEGFRRLARTRHRLDLVARDEAFYTGTLTGGTADLRSPAGAEIADGPFDEYFHTLDTRRLRGRDGRFGVNKLNFHLYRILAFEMEDVDPVQMADPGGIGILRTFTVDPSGRDIPLFIDADPPDPDAVSALPGQLSRPGCGLPLEWEVTQPMRCRLLGHVAYDVTASIIEQLQQLANAPLPADEAALFQVLEVRFDSEQAMRRRLNDLGATIGNNPPDWYRVLVGLSLVEQTGKFNLYPSQVRISAGGITYAPVQISSANLSHADCHPDPEGVLAELVISPEHGRFATSPSDDPANFDPNVDRYHYGFSGEVGAGPYLRDPIPTADLPSRTATGGVVPDGGVLQGDGLLIDDNRTYTLSIVSATPVESGILLAGPQRRPYVMLDGGGANLQPQAINSTFLIDGGWYGANDPANPPASGVADFVIEGAAGADPEDFDFESFEIRFATFDPGGLRADGIPIPPLRLLVRARIRRLIIRRCIMGPIQVVREDPDDPSVVDELLICESIVDAGETTDHLAVSSLFGTVVIESSTILGDVQAAILKASDSIVDGRVTVVNNQAGCFRFSASEPGEDVRLPPRYRDFHASIPPYTFNSTRFGDPQYGQLSIVAPEQILTGAENGSEMGVFGHLLSPIRLASVRAKVNEFGPVGMLAQYLFEGDFEPQSLVHEGELNPTPEPVDPPAPPDPGDVIPEPEPPPEPPLPTICPDQEPPIDQPPPVDVEPVPIDVPGADINGAPAFWRGLHWRPDVFPVPGGEVQEGIPFDRVRMLLEYDARFATNPEEQGWTRTGEDEGGTWNVERNHSLRFVIRRGPSFFTAQLPASEEPITQIHAYANVLLEQVPPAQEGNLQGFETRVETMQRGQPSRGMRADWLSIPERQEFHLITLDSKGMVASPRPPGEVLGAWHTVSLQADVRNDRALVSIDGQIVEIELSKFGEAVENLDGSALRAVFGFRGSQGEVIGRLRNFVVSAPGRYMRAWLKGEAPVQAPVLRLRFTADKDSSGSARFRVRYGLAKSTTGEEDVIGLPLRIAEATLKVEGDDAERVLEIPLTAAQRGDALAITVERDPLHEEDTLESSVRLMKAELAGREG